MRIVIAERPGQLGQAREIVWHFVVGGLLGEPLAEGAPEVFVADEGEDAAGVGGHAREGGEDAVCGGGLEAVSHAVEVVAEPPCGAELDLSAHAVAGEGACEHGERRMVVGVQRIQYGTGESGGGALQVVEQRGDGGEVAGVADGGVAAGGAGDLAQPCAGVA